MTTWAHSLVLFVAAVCIAAIRARAFTDSGWKQIGDPADIPLVQDLGRWAVKQHNGETGQHLAFTKTAAAAEQSDGEGLYFQLIIEGAARVGGDDYFKAVVAAVGGDTDKRRLLSFDATAPPM